MYILFIRKSKHTNFTRLNALSVRRCETMILKPYLKTDGTDGTPTKEQEINRMDKQKQSTIDILESTFTRNRKSRKQQEIDERNGAFLMPSLHA